MWQGLKTITDYKGKPRRKLPNDASLPDEVNAFHAHFEASNTEACTRAPAVPDDCDNALDSRCEQNLLNRSTFTKPLGKTDYQDVYSEHALTNCRVFTDIFNLSLSEFVIPRRFKQTTIVPVPKNTKVTWCK